VSYMGEPHDDKVMKAVIDAFVEARVPQGAFEQTRTVMCGFTAETECSFPNPHWTSNVEGGSCVPHLGDGASQGP